MENASKALIIVGAVLVALLIIGASVFIFNSVVKDSVSRSVDDMTSEERIFFNSKFERYEGGRVSGLETKALVNISLQNATYQLSINEKPRIPEISIKFKDNSNYSLTRAEINSYTEASSFKNKIEPILNKINNTSFFAIDTELNSRNGIVSKITIEELNI